MPHCELISEIENILWHHFLWNYTSEGSKYWNEVAYKLNYYRNRDEYHKRKNNIREYDSVQGMES
jgi:hypothetical protein